MKKTIALFLVIMVMILSVVSADASGTANGQIITNGYTVFSLKPGGNVMGWGRNTSGEVAIGHNQNQLSPVNVPELSNVKEIISGDDGSASFYALKHDGSVYAWGNNGYGQLGFGNTVYQSLPVIIPGLTGISQIVTDGYTVYAIKSDGTVYAWGQNNYGQVGNNSTANQTTPVQIGALSGTVSITLINSVAYAIKDNGTIYAWGRGNTGQIGNNTTVNAQKTPVHIPGLTNVEKIISNGSTTFAIVQNGAVYGWGENSSGQIGCYSLSTQLKPVLITGISQIKDVVIAGNTTYAIKSDGSLYGWGRNNYGQLANSSSFDRSYPLLITGIPPVKQLFGNGFSTCMLGTDNSVYAWGYNNWGEVGNGQIGPQRSPYKISSLNNISKIVGGGYTLFAIGYDGSLYGWGSNHSGQVGNGVTGTQRSPVQITGFSDIYNVQIHINTVFATDTYGNVYGWGANSFGQLGNGTTSTMQSPVSILQNEGETTETITTTGSGDVLCIVPTEGSINALTISVTHPVFISYSIDPNSDFGFLASDIEIQNNSKAAVRVSIESFRAEAYADLQFIDVLPENKEWDTLSLEESKSYIALGLQYVAQEQWISPEPSFLNPIYAAELHGMPVGILTKGASGSLNLSAKHGFAFDRRYTSRHKLIFIFSLV